jgi:hypothetical protein
LSRPDEEYCKTVFTEFLKSVDSTSQISWREPAQDPPDYYLTIDRDNFAVEVTQLMETYEVGNLKMPSVGMNHALVNFCRRLEKIATNEGLLQGSYCLHLEPIPDLKSKEEEIINKALKYMGRTRSFEIAGSEDLVVYQHNRIAIQKYGNSANLLEWIDTSGNAKWPGDIKDDIADIFRDVMVAKKEKMINVNEDKILLLLDRYSLADNNDWKEVVNPDLCIGFHSVALIAHDATTTILHSRNNAWLNHI